MKTIHKLAILECLDAMDHSQTEKVMQYVREMLLQGQPKVHRSSRQKAMEQIRWALQSHKAPNLHF